MNRRIFVVVFALFSLTTQGQKRMFDVEHLKDTINFLAKDAASMSPDVACTWISSWKLDTIIKKNFRIDQALLNNALILANRCGNPEVRKRILSERIKYWNFHNLPQEANKEQLAIQAIDQALQEERNEKMNQRLDSLQEELSKEQGNQQTAVLNEQHLKEEREFWMYIAGGLGAAAVAFLLLFLMKKSKTVIKTVEKEVIKRIEVPVEVPAAPVEIRNEPKVSAHADPSELEELRTKLHDMEKQFRKSLETINMQEAHKIERQYKNQEVLTHLQEAHTILKKIQENKTMTAEDFMQLSNAVQRGVAKLNS